MAQELEVYRQQMIAFEQKFGREMGPLDPFFFDPMADTPQFRSSDAASDAIDVIARLMGEAGVDPAAVYAFRRTCGLFPTDDVPMDDEDRLEWAAAVYEYWQKLDGTREQ